MSLISNETAEKIVRYIGFFYIVDGLVIGVMTLLQTLDIPAYFSMPSLFGYFPANNYVVAFNIILCVGSLLVGFGLLSKFHLARIGAILLAVPKLLDMPLGTIFGAFIILCMVLPYTNKVLGKFSKKKSPYRVVGVVITVGAFFLWAFLAGYGGGAMQTLDHEINGLPQSNIDPMQKIHLESIHGDNKDLIVEFTAPTGQYAVQQQNIAVQDIQTMGGNVLERYDNVYNGFHIRIDGDKLDDLASKGYVKSVWPNPMVKLFNTNARKIQDVHGLKESNNLMNTEWLWSNGYKGEGVTVAIMDTGINEDMQYLQRNGTSIVVDSYEKYWDYNEDYPHGTMVSCCVAGQHESHHGVATQADLIDVEIFTEIWDEEEQEYKSGAYPSDIIWGYEKVADWKDANGGFVIASCSFGIPAAQIGDTWSDPSPISRSANNLATKHNIPVVAAAGNSNQYGYKIASPATAQYVLGVGAVDKDKDYAPFSNQGPTPEGHRKPDVCNVGVNVYTFDHNGQIYVVSGTSIACPLTSGIMADIASKKPDYSSVEFYDAFRNSADDVESAGFDYKTGYGFVDGKEASKIIGQITPKKVFTMASFISMFAGVGVVFYPEWGGGIKSERKITWFS